MTAPIVPRISLGNLLKKLRDQAGLQPAQVAEAMRWNRTKVSRVEQGKTTISHSELNDLLHLYGAETGEDADHARELGVEARKRGSYGSVRADARDFVGMEANAQTMRVHYSDLIDGPLQTEDYATALSKVSVTLRTEAAKKQAVEGRMRRHHVLDSIGHYELVLGEAALRYQVGGPDVMHGQITRLLAESQRDNVSIQILTFDQAAVTQCLGIPFHIVTLAEPAKTLVYVEGLTNSQYHDTTAAVEAHMLIFERLKQVALDEDATRALLRRVLSELEKGKAAHEH